MLAKGPWSALELALLVLEHPTAFRVFRVSMLRRFIFAAKR
jgi:hypothetical protein